MSEITKNDTATKDDQGVAIIQRLSDTQARAVVALHEDQATMVITVDTLGRGRSGTTELARLIEQRWEHRVPHEIVDSDKHGDLLIWAHTDPCMRGILRALRVTSDNQGWVLVQDHEDLWFATLLVRGSSTQVLVHSSFGFRASQPPASLGDKLALAIFDTHGYYPGASRWVTQEILDQVWAACRAWYQGLGGGR